MGELLRVLTWNVRGTAREQDRKAKIAAICVRNLDIAALQEVSACNLDDLKKQLQDHGLYTIAEGGGVLIAARLPVLDIVQREMPLGSAMVSVRLGGSFGPIELNCAHVISGSRCRKPKNASMRRHKIYTFEQIASLMKTPVIGHRILCGDFNSPKTETVFGDITPFGGGPRSWDGGAQIVAERSVMEGLIPYDLKDVWRTLYFDEARGCYPAGPPPYTWEDNKPETESGIPANGRFDHIFASRSLRPQECTVHRNWMRELGLGKDDPRNWGKSDHAAVEVVFRPDRLV